MAFELVRIFVRSSTRIRCFFTDTVSDAPVGAWTVSSLAGNPNPAVAQSLIVQGSQVELVLGDPLVSGALYRLSMAGHSVDTGTSIVFFAPATSIDFYAPGTAQAVSAELSISLFQANLFGDDIAWDGSDWVEGSDGDLVVVGGPENVRTAILRRELSNGLLWDDSYGLKPDEFVDAPTGELQNLVQRAETQALADDRVKTATAKSLGSSAQNPEQQLIGVDITLIDGTSTTATVPVQAA